MRYASLFLALSLLMIVPPASAASSSSEAKQSNPIFGSKKCKPTFQCPTAATREYNADITKNVIQIATSCSQTYLGINAPGGLFENAFGLDGSNCLTTKKLPKDSSGAIMSPKCCVTPVDGTGKTCGVTCKLYSIK